MKKFLFLFTASVVAFSMSSQSFKSIYNKSTKTWLGIDYTATKFIGSVGFTEPTELPSYTEKWNGFVIIEPSKYNLEKAFISQKVGIDLEQANARNAKIDGPANIQDKDYTLSSEEAEQIALAYDYTDIDGVAMMLVAESYDKRNEKGNYWLVIVNAPTKTVIYIKSYSGKAAGFGFRNYWARTFYEVLHDIENDMRKALK